MMNSIIQNKLLRKILIAAVWIGIWQAAYVYVGKEVLIVSPFATVRKIFELIFEADFIKTIIYSILRIMGGYLGGVIFGCVMAAVCFRIKVLHDFFSPLLSVARATPVASFIILALLWIKTGIVPMAIVFIMTFPAVWTNVYQGFENIDKKLLEMAEVFRFSVLKKVKMIIIPSVLPYFKAACVNSIGLSWKSGVAAEVIARPDFAIGTKLYDSKIYLETPELFAWTAIVIILSVIIEKVVVRLIGNGDVRDDKA